MVRLRPFPLPRFRLSKRASSSFFFFSSLDAFSQLLLSADVEVVFARGTLTPEQQKKIPVTHKQDERHDINGKLIRCVVGG